MNKTVYLRDEEVPVWERARELSSDKLSPVIVTALKQFVAEKEAELKGLERIVLEYNDSEASGLPKRKAFYGRWICSPDSPIVVSDERGTNYRASVAESAKGSIVICERAENEDHVSWKFRVYSSFETAAADREFRYAAIEALNKRGVPIEELDI